MDSCNIGSWNVRGMNNKEKQNYILEFCNFSKVGVCGLLETKLRGNKIQELMENKFTNWDCYTSSSIEGWILIVWRRNFVRVIVISKSQQHVHCVVKMFGQVKTFCLTFVYGFNSIEDRKGLWQSLLQLRFPVKPWVVLGDFNSVFNVDDRIGGNPVTHTEMDDSNNWLAQAHVDKLQSNGSFFTWTNNQDGLKHIYSKIDHVFVNEDWHDDFPNTSARFCWEVTSDHCSCVISASTTELIGVKPFRYFNFWAEHQEFQTLVEKNWKIPLAARGLKGVYLKLMRVKHCLKKFNHDKIGDIGKSYHIARDNYIEAKHQAEANPRDVHFQQHVSKAADLFNIQEKMYHTFLKQRSKKRKVENRITSYTTDHGLIIEKFSKVVKHFLNHFRGYMGSKSNATARLNMNCIEQGPKLTLELQLGLLRPVTSKEIRRVMFSIPDTKSSGPDGFDSGFFKKMWPVIGGEISDAIISFFKHRLALVLPVLVHQNQGAFIQGRSIAHNVMILQDILKNYRMKNTSPRCTIKIDISKAYDTVDWQFVEDLLNALNFPGKFVQLVMNCIKSTTYSLLMNGRVQGGFQGVKGLRQGDPLSPLIFVLVMEYLSRCLLQAAQKSNFRFHPLCKNLELINLCFADDLILLSKGSKQSIKVLKSVLDEFSVTTGLFINASKSQIFFGGVGSKEKEEIIGEVGLTEGTFPLKYLGVPLRPTKWRAEDCGVILKKI
ncbi:uncharacterized protein LOC133791470 [Humulus lupulus]|uniref:uncharacterized protein LOC133791470 n=1 Tax=Humulus lupulus TaxID=3486 RepID=UPI002B40D557|nr:uncharacterized protein LOC133791470 [Humulus lupulus]